jgi:hypothetical protein
VSTEWSEYWQDIGNLRWTAVDQAVLEKVARVLGWGPDRSLLELGAGRGLHSKLLYEGLRCSRPDLYEVNPEMLLYMKRQGLNAIGDDAQLRPPYDIVWSYGVPEHYEDPVRQEIVDRHFELSRDWVLLVIPRSTWARRAFARHDRVPARDFVDAEFRERLERGARRHWPNAAATEFNVESFCPLFGIPHIPEPFYPAVEKLLGWTLPGGLLLGWGRRSG